MSMPVPDFNTFVEKVRKVFEKYSSYHDRIEYDNSIKVNTEIERILESIQLEAVQDIPFEAREQALQAAIEIAMIIDGERSILGKLMREDLPQLPFKSTISRILDTLTPEELAALQADGEIAKSLREIRSRWEDHALDLEIDDSIDRLWLEESDQEDDAQMTVGAKWVKAQREASRDLGFTR